MSSAGLVKSYVASGTYGVSFGFWKIKLQSGLRAESIVEAAPPAIGGCVRRTLAVVPFFGVHFRRAVSAVTTRAPPTACPSAFADNQSKQSHSDRNNMGCAPQSIVAAAPPTIGGCARRTSAIVTTFGISTRRAMSTTTTRATPTACPSAFAFDYRLDKVTPRG